MPISCACFALHSSVFQSDAVADHHSFFSQSLLTFFPIWCVLPIGRRTAFRRRGLTPNIRQLWQTNGLVRWQAALKPDRDSRRKGWRVGRATIQSVPWGGAQHCGAVISLQTAIAPAPRKAGIIVNFMIANCTNCCHITHLYSPIRHNSHLSSPLHTERSTPCSSSSTPSPGRICPAAPGTTLWTP